MKLAAALQERADLNRRINQINSRLSNNAVTQDGEQPAENPTELLVELNSCISTLEILIAKINLTNCATILDGQSITKLIAKKDCLVIKLSSYRELIYSASQLVQRATRTEIKIISTVDVKELQKTVDTLAKELRQLDNNIQELNWKTELQG